MENIALWIAAVSVALATVYGCYKAFARLGRGPGWIMFAIVACYNPPMIATVAYGYRGPAASAVIIGAVLAALSLWIIGRAMEGRAPGFRRLD